MTLWRTIGEILAHWTETVATGVIALASRFVSPRLVRLVEDDKPDTFALEGAGKAGDAQRVTFANGRFSGADLADSVKGSRIELVLRPSRFLVRPLELPARATEFIEGIVRVQIDRLTPWTAAEAVFGCGTPVTAGSGKIVTTIAATTRANTEPYIAGLAALHPASLSIFTRAGEETRELIKVFEKQARGLLDRPRLSRLLRLVLAGVTAAAVLSTAAGAVMQNYLDSRQAELDGRAYRAPHRAPPRPPRRRQLAVCRAGAAQARNPGERDRDRGALPHPARPHLRHSSCTSTATRCRSPVSPTMRRR